jgi:deoxycytidylate deaminase
VTAIFRGLGLQVDISDGQASGHGCQVPYALPVPTSSRRSEIVIGLVSALGTELEVVERAITTSLLSVGYASQTVRVSELLVNTYEELKLGPLPGSTTKLDRLMDIGDAFRVQFNDGAMASRLAVSAISANRFEDLRLSEPLGEGQPAPERLATATTIRQLKHPEEVELLRSVYGPRFVLIGAWSPESDRRRSIRARLTEMHPHQDDSSWYDGQAARLLRRDENDSRHALGQRVRDTFELADAYVALRQGYGIEAAIGRIIRLLFAAPFETPTQDEHAMYQAAGARLRSSASGRQVGAVVVDEHGDVLVTGMNDVPKAGGGQYWSGDEPDYRDFRLGFDFNDREQLSLIADTLARLRDSGWLAKPEQDTESAELARQALEADGPFRRSRIADLLAILGRWRFET